VPAWAQVDSLRFVREVRIVPWSPPGTPPPDRPLCERDSIRVLVRGAFPDDCYRLVRVEVLDLAATPLPAPPLVRLVVDDGGCLGRPCAQVITPFEAAATLAPLPARLSPYALPLQLGISSCGGPIPPDRLYATSVPFAVAESCGEPPPPGADCLLASWLRPPADATGCDAYVGPAMPAQLALAVRSTVALAGLQGGITMSSPAALRVTGVEAIGPAAGMRLAWVRTDLGADYVLFAPDGGAPIPPADPTRPAPAVLRFTLATAAGVPPPPVTHVYLSGPLGADINGAGVPPCPTLTLVAETARICARPRCDFNGDGASDVRDLVSMVRCLHDPTACPDTTGGRADCNRDGGFDLDDVLCCARSVLSGDRPPGGGTRPEPAVHVTLGAPVPADGGALVVPLAIEGAERLGAAAFDLVFPAGDYQLAGVDAGPDGRDWLCLSEERAGGARIGMVALGSPPDGGRRLELALRLVPRAGAGEGTLAVSGGEFAGPDGVLLDVALGHPVAVLMSGAPGLLSAAWPNPSRGEVRFAVALARAGEARVDVFDLAGRRVRALYQGRLDSAGLDLAWDGRLDDGTRAPGGVYFLRLAAPGVTRTRALVRLPGR
jgi:hypothetical protein